MKSRERLLECKIKLKISSDYGLAKALEINRARVHDYMNGKRTPDAYTAVKMAEILKIHPLLLIAEFEEEKEKDLGKKAFWGNFERRIKAGAVGIVVLISTAFWSPEPRAGELVQHARNSFSHNWRLWRKWLCHFTKPTLEEFYLGT